MNDLQIFKNQNFGEVRTVLIESEVWFVAKDVAVILEYYETSNMLKRLDDDEKRKFEPSILEGANSKARKFTMINESGLYTAILGSKKPEAKRFKKWITSEVLPTIRKTGSYSIDDRNSDGWGQTRLDGKYARKNLALV